MDDQAQGEALRAHLCALLEGGEHWFLALSARHDRRFLGRVLSACQASGLAPRPPVELVGLDEDGEG